MADELADLADVWNRAINQLDDPSVRPHQRAWLSLTRPIGLLEDTALLAAPNTYAKDYLENNLRPLITAALSEALGREINVAVTIQPIEPAERHSLAAADAEVESDPETGYDDGEVDTYDRFDEPAEIGMYDPASSYGSSAMLRPDHEARLNPKYTFDTFVAGFVQPVRPCRRGGRRRGAGQGLQPPFHLWRFRIGKDPSAACHRHTTAGGWSRPCGFATSPARNSPTTSSTRSG